MRRLTSYVVGAFAPEGPSQGTIVNPATEEPLAEISGAEPDGGAVLAYARERGGAALGALTFGERGALLKRTSRALHAHRDELLALAIANGGNTRSDAKFDVDGATGTLMHYGELGEALGSARLLPDGAEVQLGRSPRFVGQHVLGPRRGAALLVNAFNFPAWGWAEKAACALLAGMPIVVKPASATALVAHRMVEIVAAEGLLPDGALQLVVGTVGSLVDALGGRDVLAFTGSSDTAARLRAHPRVVAENVRVNVEADSLNAAVLGPDAEPGGATYDLFVADVVRDMTQKTGQKCTAIRRAFVPSERLAQVGEDLAERLAVVKVGDPALDEVTMGPVATARQLADVRAGIRRLADGARSVFGDGSVAPIGVPAGKGFFVGPVLLAGGGDAAHVHEVFGPVASLLTYADAADAVRLVARGGGGLVASVYSDDRAFLGDVVRGIAAASGRVYVGSAKVAGQMPGPGTVLPQLVHGGPGRAGNGEELGGMRGLSLYLQRTAISGDKALLEAILGATGR